MTLGETEPRSWAALIVERGGEARAEASITALGYEAYVPRFNRLIRGYRGFGREGRIRCRGDTVQPRPLISPYMFVLIPSTDAAWSLDTAAGVRRVLRYRDADGYLGKPKIVRARLVEQVREAALAMDETPKPKAVRTDIKPGDKIRAPGGIEATLLSLDANGRARYMAQILGTDVLGTIDDAEELVLVQA